MAVIDDGTTASLASLPRHSAVVAEVIEHREKTLTPVQGEVASIIIVLGAATHSRIHAIRGVDSQDTLDRLVERDLLSIDAGETSRLYRPTGRLLAAMGCQTLEEARARAGLGPDAATAIEDGLARMGFSAEAT